MKPQKSLISIILFLIGGILVIVGLSLIDNSTYEKQAGKLVLVAIGLIIATFGILTIEKGIPKWLNRVFEWFEKYSIKEWQLCCLLVSMPIVIVVPFAAGTGQKMLNPLIALSTWFLAIGLVLAGGWIQPAAIRWPSWRLIVCMVALTGVAFLVRVIMLNRIPITLTGDEAAAGIAAEDFTRGTWNNIFITGWYAFPSFFFTIPSFFIGLLGHTIEALRIPSALAGALTVTATFFVARAMFGKHTAWFAAIFLTVLHFHVHFSRIGLNNIWDGLWYIITIGALWYGWDKDRRNAYLLAGLSLGFSQYFYSSSHTILILIVGWIVLALILDRPRLKKAWVNLVLMVLVAMIVALPLIWFYMEFPNTFMEPMNRVALTSGWLRQQVISTGTPAWKIILNQAMTSIFSFTNEPLRAWYTPGVPLLRPYAASLFLIGILLLFFRGKKWQIIPILLWIFAFMAIGGFSESTPAAQRYVAAAPVCAIVVGYGLCKITELVAKSFENSERWIIMLSYFLVVILAIDELYFYFGVYTPHSVISNARSNDVVAQTLVNYLETESTNTEVLFFGFPNMGYYSIPSIEYLVPNIKGIDINQSWSVTGKPALTTNHLIFIFLPNNLEQIPPVQTDYPGGKLTSIQAADGYLLYKMYEVSAPFPIPKQGTSN